ncbi:hypothetical protein AAVH_15115 [Aphelenchoides avenae]|nr:hypothetical protein AAVH_15115 [Aphelenchus avenae]
MSLLKTLASATFAICVLVSAACMTADALFCFVSTDNGTLMEEANDSWTYCSFVPYFWENGEGSQKETAFGVDAENGITDTFGLEFNAPEPFLTVLSFCVMEASQYNMPKPTIQRRRRVHTERMMRCICNTNLCNHPHQLRVFL